MEGSKRVLRERERKLYEASLSGSVDSLNELMKEDELILARGCVTWVGETPLHIAAMLGHTDFLIQLVHHMPPDRVTKRDSQGFSPLHFASANGYIEIVKKLLMINADVCLLCDEDGRTPLHLAVMNGHVQVINELVRAKPEVIQLKLNRGETLLHSCLKHNRLEALKVLVELGGVDDLINVKDDNGFTILHLATALKQMETIKYLLNRSGVKVNAVNGNGFTALDMMEHMPRDLKVMEICESLLNAGVLRAINLPVADGRYSTAVAPPLDVPPTVEISRPPSRGDSSIKKHKKSWLEKKRNALMVVATVIATMAYQAGLNPPGGVWQQDDPIGKNGEAKYLTGESTMAYTHPDEYPLFWITNTVSFVASLSIVLLLVSGIPMKRRLFMWILMAAMWVTTTFMAFTYLIAMYVISPSHYFPNNTVNIVIPPSQYFPNNTVNNVIPPSQYFPNNAVNNDISPSQYLPAKIYYFSLFQYLPDSNFYVIQVSVIAWMGLIAIIFLVHTVRLLIRCIRKVIKLVKMCFSCCSTRTPGRSRGRTRGHGRGLGNV